MKVDSHNIEFGYELLSAIPYAYELYLKGQLTETVSGVGSEPLYYFSPKHTINSDKRSWFNTKKARESGLPYTTIHKPEQPDKKFPDYKKHYSNHQYKWSKPTLCICNRYNKEWSTRAINFFDEEILDWLFSNLKSKYEIVYFPVSIPSEIQDNESPMALDDISVAKKHKVRIFTDMFKGKQWNEVMLKVFANCDHYITMNGGYSIMASYFSGTNIVYSLPGKPEAQELKNKSFWRWYPNINNVRTLHVESYDSLKERVQSICIDEQPCVNILIRTHRPNYLSRCMDSIKSQTYSNINVVFICDSDIGIVGTRNYNARQITVEKSIEKPIRPEGINYGVHFPYNKYLDQAQRMVNGYIAILDDDDKFMTNDAVEKIVNKADKDKLVIWRADFNSMGIIPKDSFGKRVKLYDIGGICFCYHTDHIDKTDWSEWKRADFRTAHKLSQSLKVVWIDEVLTGIQDVLGRGIKKDLKKTNETLYKLTFPDGHVMTQYFTDNEIRDYASHFKAQNICIESTT